MSTPVASNNYSQSFGTATTNEAVVASFNPSSTNIRGPNGNFKIGQRWINNIANNTWTLTSISSAGGTVSANWVEEGESGTGGITQIDTQSGNAIPASGIVTLNGAANQLTTSASGSTVTVGLTSLISSPSLSTINTSVYLGNGVPFNASSSNSGNVAVGYQAMQDLASTVADNTAIGAGVLQLNNAGLGKNVGVGYNALNTIVSGTSNVALGYLAGLNYGGVETNNILIGASVEGTIGESNVIRIGNNSHTSCIVQGISGATSTSGVAVLVNSSGVLGTTTSSLRYKKDIEDMKDVSSKIHDLRPVTFKFKKQEDDRIQVGLIAEEVDKVLPFLVVRDKDNQPETVQYHDLIPMLLNEVQKLKKQVADLERPKIKRCVNKFFKLLFCM